MLRDMSATSATATVTSTDDLNLNIRFGDSGVISLSRTTATAPAPSAFTISGCPQESSEQSGTPGSPPGAGELRPLVIPMPSRPSIPTELEGTTPPMFDGTGVAARHWFNRVELHFFVNQQSTAAKDPLRKIGLTLCWIRGSRVDYWVNRQINWLMEQENGRNAVADPWAEFREAFLETFTYISEVRRANADLKKLEMKDGDIDEYIGTFANLADLAQISLDSSLTLEMFWMGLPRYLAKKCLLSAQEWPKTFKECCASARHHQANIDKWNSLQVDKERTNTNGNDKTFWTRNRGNTQVTQQAQVSLAGSSGHQCATDIGVKRRAATEEDKEKYPAGGPSFRCSEQGHISRNHPSRMPQVPIA